MSEEQPMTPPVTDSKSAIAALMELHLRLLLDSSIPAQYSIRVSRWIEEAIDGYKAADVLQGAEG